MGKTAHKPTKLKALEGNRGHRPPPQNEPEPDGAIPGRPGNLNKTAGKYWDEYTPMINRIGLLTEVDGTAFATLCQIMARLDYIYGKINSIEKQLGVDDIDVEEKVVLEKRMEYFWKEERHYTPLKAKLSGDFGMHPRGRVGLTVGSGKKDKKKSFLT